MHTLQLNKQKILRLITHSLSILVILAIGIPASASVTQPDDLTQDPNILASITFDWFEALDFAPETTLHIQIFDAPAGALLWEADRVTDSSGFVHIGTWEHPVDLVPGIEIEIEDGTSAKELELVAVTLDVFDPVTDILSGTAPLLPGGQPVRVAIGNESIGCEVIVYADQVTGFWSVDFSAACDVTEDMWAAAQVFDADGDVTEANPTPNPSFVIFPEWEAFDGNGWPSGVTVAINVAGKPECTTSAESFRYFFNGSFPADCAIVFGDVVTFSNGVTTRTHTVRALEVTGVDLVNDTVSGTASPGAEVHVWPHAAGETQLVTANASGEWLADFSGIFDIVAGEFGRSAIYDAQGNSTAVDWGLPSPHMVIFPEVEFFDGLDWPDGDVDISIAGKPECALTKVSADLFFNGNFPEGCDVAIGDTVTYTNGVTTRTHTVFNLGVTDLDLLNDTVSGTADPGAEVHVWPHATGQVVVVNADGAGNWLADFSGIFDLVVGEFGRSTIWDNQGNATAVDWGIPSPRMVIFPEWEFFDGLDWPDGDVNITVAGKPLCSLTKESLGGFFNGNFPEGCDVVVGDTVTFSDGLTIRTHVVFDLAITQVDVLADTVAGVADPGAQVHVWPHESGESEQLVTAGQNGAWLADFSGLFDLVPGTDGRSEIRDAEGNGTAVDFHAANPHIVATITWDWFEAKEFAPETPLQIQIFASPGGALLWEAERVTDASGFVNIGSWEHPVDLLPGVTLVIDDGISQKTLTLEALTMDEFDVASDFVSGTAPAPFGRRVWVGTGNDTSGCSADLTSDPVTGAWEVDFSLAQPPCDITDDMWGAAQVFDADIDATEVNPTPSPSMVIFPEWEWFDGNGWPTGIPVAISVAGKSQCTTTAESERYFFNGGFPAGCDIVFGDVVTFTNGATTRTHTVRALAVSRVDKPGDTVAGTASSGAEVYVWPHDGSEFVQRVVAGAGAAWLADFSGLFDIEAGHAGRAEIRDAQGNATAVDWLALYELSLPVIFNP